MTEFPKRITISRMALGFMVAVDDEVTVPDDSILACLTTKDDLLDYLQAALPSDSDLATEITSGPRLEYSAPVTKTAPGFMIDEDDGPPWDDVPETIAAPEPEPEPETVAAPEPEPEVETVVNQKPQTAVKSKEKQKTEPTYRTGTWSEEETRISKEMIRAGQTCTPIAAKLNRKPESVSVKLVSLRRKMAEEDARDKPSARPVKEPTPKTPGRPAAPVHVAPVLGASLGVLDLPPCAIPDWRVRDDLSLMDALTRGVKPADFAVMNEITTDQVVTRFRELLPEVTIKAQANLLKKLRAAVKQGAMQTAAE